MHTECLKLAVDSPKKKELKNSRFNAPKYIVGEFLFNCITFKKALIKNLFIDRVGMGRILRKIRTLSSNTVYHHLSY